MDMTPFRMEHAAIKDADLPLSVERYHELNLAGNIHEKTELLAGVVVEKMTKNPRHSEVLQRLFEFFYEAMGKRFRVRTEQPLTFMDSEPEPDISIVDDLPGGYFTEHPRKAHLVVEVSDSSLVLDRKKAAIYAAAGIPEYWIVNLLANRIERKRAPSATGYRQQELLTFSDAVTPDCAPNCTFCIGALL